MFALGVRTECLSWVKPCSPSVSPHKSLHCTVRAVILLVFQMWKTKVWRGEITWPNSDEWPSQDSNPVIVAPKLIPSGNNLLLDFYRSFFYMAHFSLVLMSLSFPIFPRACSTKVHMSQQWVYRLFIYLEYGPPSSGTFPWSLEIYLCQTGLIGSHDWSLGSSRPPCRRGPGPCLV